MSIFCRYLFSGRHLKRLSRSAACCSTFIWALASETRRSGPFWISQPNRCDFWIKFLHLRITNLRQTDDRPPARVWQRLSHPSPNLPFPVFLWCPTAGWAGPGRDAVRGSTESHLRLPGHRGEWRQWQVPAPILHPGHGAGQPAVVHGQPTGVCAIIFTVYNPTRLWQRWLQVGSELNWFPVAGWFLGFSAQEIAPTAVLAGQLRRKYNSNLHSVRSCFTFVCFPQQNLPEGAQNVGSLNLTYISKVCPSSFLARLVWSSNQDEQFFNASRQPGSADGRKLSEWSSRTSARLRLRQIGHQQSFSAS